MFPTRRLLGLLALTATAAEPKAGDFVHGDRDPILSVAFARENRDKYQKEGHPVKYVEVAGLGHMWATKNDINDTIWRFFADHPRTAK